MAELPVIDERGERCETCRFWRPNHINSSGPCETDGGYGDCRRYPPAACVPDGIKLILETYLRSTPDKCADDVGNCDLTESLAINPIVEGSDWCGEWQAKA